jgi:predicted dehydrogenase
VRSRYLEIVGLQEDEFDSALRYSFEDYFFLKAIEEDRPAFPDFRTALDAHRTVDAVYRSAAANGAEIALA